MGRCSRHNLERDKWSHCPECKKRSDFKYETSLKGKKTITKRNNSANGKIARRLYADSIKGRLRNLARRRVSRAIRSDKIKKLPCVVCENPKSEAHHAWGYSEEHLLHVIFLCRTHHRQAEYDQSFNEHLKSQYKPF